MRAESTILGELAVGVAIWLWSYDLDYLFHGSNNEEVQDDGPQCIFINLRRSSHFWV